MIPHRIHQLWLGPRPVPTKWCDQWRAMHPDWEYILWRDSDVAALGLANQATYDRYARLGIWYGAADVARVEILFRFGGVYLDADSEPLRPWDDAPFMASGFFAAYEYRDDRPGRIANGVIGAEAQHPILATYIDMIAKLPSIDPPWDTVGGTALTAAVAAHPERTDVAILPMATFYPRHYTGMVPDDRVEPWAVQHWASTVGGYE